MATRPPNQLRLVLLQGGSRLCRSARACGGDPRERRRQALAELAALAEERGGAAFEPTPEALIREDRER